MNNYRLFSHDAPQKMAYTSQPHGGAQHCELLIDVQSFQGEIPVESTLLGTYLFTQVPLDEGLQKTIDYFRNELEHAAKMMEVSQKP